MALLCKVDKWEPSEEGHGRLWWWSCLLLRSLHKYVESTQMGKRHPFSLKQTIKDIYQKYQLIESKMKIQCWIECFVSCFKVNLSPEKYHTYQILDTLKLSITHERACCDLKLNILRDQGNGTWSFCFSVLGPHIKLAQVAEMSRHKKLLIPLNVWKIPTM